MCVHFWASNANAFDVPLLAHDEVTAREQTAKKPNLRLRQQSMPTVSDNSIFESFTSNASTRSDVSSQSSARASMESVGVKVLQTESAPQPEF